ncbi:MAG: Hint domain-containing protein [Gemmobacter sp.]
MATYSVWMLEAENVTVSDGGSLSGFTQGDGSHLVGRTITLNAPNWVETRIADDDGNFDDNDANQRLDGAQTIGGVTYASGTVVEAEYLLTLEDPDTGQQYQVIGYNIRNSNPAFGTIEGLSFVGPPSAWPPVGKPLVVVRAQEGPGFAGVPTVSYTNLVVPCFTPGTLIAVPGGQWPVEALAPGDPVLTRDAGPQPLVALARTALGPGDLARAPHLAPVTIRAGAFGPGRPARDLTVSPQHRILIGGARAELLFGAPEVLAAAIHLVNGTTVVQRPVRRVTYLHLVLGGHHIVWSEGLETESFQAGPTTLAAAPPGLRAELAALFPDACAARSAPAARPALAGWEARLLAPPAQRPRVSAPAAAP